MAIIGYIWRPSAAWANCVIHSSSSELSFIYRLAVGRKKGCASCGFPNLLLGVEKFSHAIQVPGKKVLADWPAPQRLNLYVLVWWLLISLLQSSISSSSLTLYFAPIFFFLESFISFLFIVRNYLSTLSNFLAHSWFSSPWSAVFWAHYSPGLELDELISLQNFQISCYLLINLDVRLLPWVVPNCPSAHCFNFFHFQYQFLSSHPA